MGVALTRFTLSFPDPPQAIIDEITNDVIRNTTIKNIRFSVASILTPS
jgi:hypothetical protein